MVLSGTQTIPNSATIRNKRIFASRSRRRPRSYLANFVEALAEALFEALVGGLIVGAAGEIVGEAGHVGDLIVEIVGVFVALAVADIFHQSGYGVAEVEGDGISFGFLDVFEDGAVAGVESVGFGRKRKIDGGLRESQMTLGRAE